MGDETQGLTIEYRLPVTIVRFAGDIVTVTDKFKSVPDVRKEIEANAIVDIRADSRSSPSLAVREEDLGQLNLNMKLLQDGRLSGSEAEFDDQTAERLSAALSAGVSTTSALMPFLSGAGVPGVVIAGAAGVGAAIVSGSWSLFGGSIAVRSSPDEEGDYAEELSEGEAEEIARALELSDPKTRSRPSALEVGIEARFERDQPAAYRVLHAYRVALLYLTQAHADQAERAAYDAEAGANALRFLDRALRSTREEASRVEEIYRVWRDGFISREKERVDQQLFIDEVPETSAFLTQVRSRAVGSQSPKWWDLAKKLRLMVTCDLEVTDSFPAAYDQARNDFDDGTILHRLPIPARLTTWRLRRSDSGEWFADEERTDWVLVAHPKGTRATRLPVKGDDRQLSVEFDANGAITSVQTLLQGASAQSTATLAGLPATLSAAVTNGAALGSGLSPATARAAALKAQVEELEMRAKRQGLLNPAPDSLADVKKKLVEAELEARLSVARRLKTDPSSVIVVARQPGD